MSHDPKQFWTERTRQVLQQGRGKMFNRDYEVGSLAPDRVKWVQEQLLLQPKLPRVLEIGCGFGRWSSALLGHYTSFTGVDVVPERIDRASSEWGSDSTHFQVIPADGVWDIEEKFDVVLFVTVLQHLPLQTACSLLQTAAKHLEPGGVLLLVEWQFHNKTPQEVAQIAHAEHMFPKPMVELQKAIPDMTWTGGAGGYIVR